MSPEPTSDNLTSPKGDARMPDDSTDPHTATGHQVDGVSTVPKDPQKAEEARTGEKVVAGDTSEPTYAEPKGDGGAEDNS